MIDNLPQRETFSKLFFAQPNNFNISYEINPYMDKNKEVGNYRKNWVDCVKKLREHINVNTVDYETYEIDGQDIKQLPDSVFIANHGLGIPGSRKVILSNMKNQERSDETKYFEELCQHKNYRTNHISEEYNFEGEGDAKWHPKKDLLWLAHGFRSDYGALNEIDDIVNSDTVKLELINEKYYHLDVCFKPLGVDDVLIIPEAFKSGSVDKIKNIFDNVYTVPDTEKESFACNCLRLPNGKVAIDDDNVKTIELIENIGYETVKVNTKQFRKAGGSIDCLTIKMP